VCGLLGSLDWLLLVEFSFRNSGDEIVSLVFVSLAMVYVELIRTSAEGFFAGWEGG